MRMQEEDFLPHKKHKKQRGKNGILFFDDNAGQIQGEIR